MSYDIRLGAGDITAYDLLNTSSYLINNWTRQADMGTAIPWLAVQPDTPLLQTFVPGLEIGTGNYYGKFATTIRFDIMTEDMRQYMDTNIMSNKPIAKVTAYLEHPINGFGVYTGELVSPFVAGGSFTRWSQGRYLNVTYAFRRATLKNQQVIGTLSGDAIGTLTGEVIALENQS